MATQVAPENVIGRDKLIARIWQMLAQSSLRFTAERRVGKTTVMKKMAAEPEDGYELLFLELEGIASPSEFVELLLNRLKPLLSKTDKAKDFFNKTWKELGGIEIGGVLKLTEKDKIEWKPALEKTLLGACEHHSDKKLVLLLDELPYMLQKIATLDIDNSQRISALTLLDTLRSIRQQCPNLRMIFAGSVGLHHVISELKQSVLASEPVNDMPAVDIRSLETEDALMLVERLLEQEKINYLKEEAVAIGSRIVELTDAVPFYIEAVCTRLSELERDIDSSDVDAVVSQQLTNDLDPWEMEHFRERLPIYYTGTVPTTTNGEISGDKIARAVLDHMALSDEPQSIEQVWSVIKSQFQITDRQHVLQMLRSLSQDHYLISDTSKCYSFRFPLIKNWWKLAQGLGN